MSMSKVSELPNLADFALDDYAYVVDKSGNSSAKTTLGDLANFFKPTISIINYDAVVFQGANTYLNPNEVGSTNVNAFTFSTNNNRTSATRFVDLPPENDYLIQYIVSAVVGTSIMDIRIENANVDDGTEAHESTTTSYFTNGGKRIIYRYEPAGGDTAKRLRLHINTPSGIENYGASSLLITTYKSMVGSS